VTEEERKVKPKDVELKPAPPQKTPRRNVSNPERLELDLVLDVAVYGENHECLECGVSIDGSAGVAIKINAVNGILQSRGLICFRCLGTRGRY
jgi:hypothetical protein